MLFQAFFSLSRDGYTENEPFLLEGPGKVKNAGKARAKYLFYFLFGRPDTTVMQPGKGSMC
jgi:hypothetical protein